MILTCFLLALFSFGAYSVLAEKILIDDIGRLNPTPVKEILKNTETEELQQALRKASEKNLKVSIAGKRHSMGGHAFYDDSVVLDMTSYNKILSLDVRNKLITVQSGSTWEDIQNVIQPEGLSIKVMQAYNIFTIGGSMSVNVHESDIRQGPLIDSIRSFRLLTANSTILNVSRTSYPELFSLVNGGYGLFGIILDVDIGLMHDEVYEQQETLVNYQNYTHYFLEHKDEFIIHFARLSIAPGKNFLRETHIINYVLFNTTDSSIFSMQKAQPIRLKKALFDLSRRYNWGKKLRWHLQKKIGSDFGEQKIISRNNLMRENIHYLDYYSRKDTDILQEYFIPPQNFEAFIDKLRDILEENKVNLLSATVRYLPANNESYLSYSPEESFAIVLYINQPLSSEGKKKAERWTQRIIDEAILVNGTFYLPYALYATPEQLYSGYPTFTEFIRKKMAYDQKELFTNTFYEKYKETGRRD